jgi:hypothetical protein
MISKEEFSKPLIYALILCVGVFIYLVLKNRKPKVVDFSNAKIGFIGAGKLTEILIQGLITYGKVEASRLHVSAPSTKNLERLKHQFSGLHVSKRNIDIFRKYDCDIVFVAVHGSVIKNCYKHGGQRPAPLTTDFIPIMKHPLYILSLVCGYDLNSIKACPLNPKHPEKYLLEMHRIMFFQLLEGRDCFREVLTISAYVLSIVNLIARSWPNRSGLCYHRWRNWNTYPNPKWTRRLLYVVRDSPFLTISFKP